MTFGDRFSRAVFVSLAVGLGWGIRGDFGHMVGAMYPGACLGLAFAYATGNRAMYRWMPLLGAAAALGIATGGTMSYGVLHGYAQSDTLRNYAYGFLMLFLQGGAWGVFGCAAVGLLLEREKVTALQWFGAVATVFASGWLAYFVVVDLVGFHVNPPRSDSSVAFTGGAVGLFVWLALNRKPLGLRAAVLGYVGFGTGMVVGRLLGNTFRVLQTGADGTIFQINDWNVMEVSVGLIGGFVFAFGMLGQRFAEPPEREGVPYLTVLSTLYMLGLIPLLHRLGRIELPKKVEEWTATFRGMEYVHAEGWAWFTYYAANAAVVMGFAIAIAWLLLQRGGRTRAPWLPILGLNLVMVLFQAFNSLYFFYERGAPYFLWYGTLTPPRFNMHDLFWTLLAALTAIVVAWELRGGPGDADEADEGSARGGLWRWAVAGLTAYAIVVVGAGFVNGKETMKSANTRWPVWEWRSGPFPGSSAATTEPGAQTRK